MTDREAGLTLVEMLAALVITVLVSSAAATAFFAFLQNYEETNQRYVSSDDKESAAAYFAYDVQGADEISNEVCDPTGVGSSGSSSYDRIISFTGTDLSTVTQTSSDEVMVSYVTPSTDDKLIRMECVKKSGTSTYAFEQQIVVMTQLKTSPAPSVQCQTGSNVGNCTQGNAPAKVLMTVTANDGSSAGLTFTLVGHRRRD